MKAPSIFTITFLMVFSFSLTTANAILIGEIDGIPVGDLTKIDGVSNATVSRIMRINYEPTTGFTLTVTTTGNGTVTIDPVKVTYDAGDSVELTVSPDAGYEFYSWDDSSNHTDIVPARSPEYDTLILTITGDTTITANFAYIINSTVTDGAHGSYDARTCGIIFSSNYDGDAPAASVTGSTGTIWPNSKYFIQGPGFTTDYPLILLDHNNPTVQNCVFDDEADIGDDNGGTAPSGGSLTIMVRAASTMQNCTLNRAHKYGIGFTDADGATITGCNVTWAQYCISGNSNATNCEVSWNRLSNMGLVGIKIKDMQHCTVENNYVDLTPNNYWTTGQGKYGIDFSDDVAGQHGNVVQNNTFIRAAAGTYPTITTGGMNVDSGCDDAGGNSFINNVVNKTNADWPRMYGVVLQTGSDYFTITGNTFTNCYPEDDAILGDGAGHCVFTTSTIIPTFTASTELINFSSMSPAESQSFLDYCETQNMTKIILRIPSYSDFTDGAFSPTYKATSIQIIAQADAMGIDVWLDLHTWYTTWDSYFDDSVAGAGELAYRATYLTYVADAINDMVGNNVAGWYVLNEPQAQYATSGENTFILNCITTAQALTSEPVGVRFMGGYSPATGRYSMTIWTTSDFCAINTYWDPRSPGTTVYGVNEGVMDATIIASENLGKDLYITEFGKKNTSGNEIQRAYVEAFVTYAKSEDITWIACWASNPDGTGEDYDIWNGYTPRPAWYELTNP